VELEIGQERIIDFIKSQGYQYDIWFMKNSTRCLDHIVFNRQSFKGIFSTAN